MTPVLSSSPSLRFWNTVDFTPWNNLPEGSYVLEKPWWIPSPTSLQYPGQFRSRPCLPLGVGGSTETKRPVRLSFSTTLLLSGRPRDTDVGGVVFVRVGVHTATRSVRPPTSYPPLLPRLTRFLPFRNNLRVELNSEKVEKKNCTWI